MVDMEAQKEPLVIPFEQGKNSVYKKRCLDIVRESTLELNETITDLHVAKKCTK